MRLCLFEEHGAGGGKRYRITGGSPQPRADHRRGYGVSQQEVLEESLSEEEEVRTKTQSSGAIRKILKAWATLASNIKHHHRSMH
ncbi:hypothetical protein AVEN_32191-1 [Araneus ventricosus]|uniref:Uncharacterized protein n=1 Tax=Araneus ventricosus TaxID=182803 RepID=A0A4Y2IU04_ARAVE|nr:hypothetical protein AVEN_242664-1 [Araneus ventricosus]GBM80406.1 hypothetical protein AVEN_32191-1 [Araneus ventricosus]